MKNKVPYYGKPIDDDIYDYLGITDGRDELRTILSQEEEERYAYGDDENTDLPPGDYNE